MQARYFLSLFFNLRTHGFSGRAAIFEKTHAAMKKLLFFVCTLLFTAAAFCQQAEESKDAAGNKVLKGFVLRKTLMTDPAFDWFAQNQTDYTPYPAALNELKAQKDSINFIVFGGTWCGDTKFILPKFYKLADAAGVSPDRITLFGVDHNKKTLQHLSEALNVTHVPTIIVMKNGHELGRVVEYGKMGMFDKELGEIISQGH